MARILAIDYGNKRVGIAVTDELQMIASPHSTVSSAEIFVFLKKYFAEENVERIVVGKPTQMNGTDSESMQFVTSFVKQFSKLFPTMPLDMVDERFTSKMASAVIAQSGMGKKSRQDKSLIDKVSAAIILQSYLESKSFLR